MPSWPLKMLKKPVKHLILITFSFVFAWGFLTPAKAEPKYWYYDWGEWNDKWKEDKKYSPYLEHPTEPVHGHWQARNLVAICFSISGFQGTARFPALVATSRNMPLLTIKLGRWGPKGRWGH